MKISRMSFNDLNDKFNKGEIDWIPDIFSCAIPVCRQAGL